MLVRTRPGLPASPDCEGHLSLHPAVQDGLPQLPAIAKLKRRYLPLRDVTVERIRGDTQVLRRLPYVHEFAGFNHSGTPPRRLNSRPHFTNIQVRRRALRIGLGGTTRRCSRTFYPPTGA